MQLNVGLGPNALELFECHSFVVLCVSAPFAQERFIMRFETFLMRRGTTTQIQGSNIRAIFERTIPGDPKELHELDLESKCYEGNQGISM